MGYQGAEVKKGQALLVVVAEEGDDPPSSLAEVAAEAGVLFSVLRWSVGKFSPTWPLVALEQYAYAEQPKGLTLWSNSGNFSSWSYKPRISYEESWSDALSKTKSFL